MPQSDWHAAMATFMQGVFQTRHQIRDAAQAAADAKDGSPSTATRLAFHTFSLLSRTATAEDAAKRLSLCSISRLGRDGCHLADAAAGTVDDGGEFLEGSNRDGVLVFVSGRGAIAGSGRAAQLLLWLVRRVWVLFHRGGAVGLLNRD